MTRGKFDSQFWRGRRVFLTGHTGFKGSWLSRILIRLGASVTGYALPPEAEPALFTIGQVHKGMTSVLGDILDVEALEKAFDAAKPEVVIHMAAQPLVRRSYAMPVRTYAVNVMGTIHLLECVRRCECARSVIVVTTDKVYENAEWEWGYRETDRLGGSDPYSNSKACAELATDCYSRSFLAEKAVAVSAMRAGNVVGGGDFSGDRIIPDCVRAAMRGEAIIVRNPSSVRPYQHVLEPLHAYLMVAERQCRDAALAGRYNVGPEEKDAITTGELADAFCRAWGNGATWRSPGRSDGPHEAGTLRLDCSRIRTKFGWRPVLDAATAVAWTVEWAKAYAEESDTTSVMDSQISRYEAMLGIG